MSDVVRPELVVEHRLDPLGIGTPTPRLSWTVPAGATPWAQAAYEIEARSGLEAHSTGWIAGSAAVLVAWPFEPLVPRQIVGVRVRVRSAVGDVSAWSEQRTIEVGLVAGSVNGWVADPIHAPALDSVDPLRPIRFRRTFVAADDVVSARLYVTALGTFAAWLNGDEIGDQVLAPGWTSYRHRIHYHTFDVTEQIVEGENALGVTVAEGWYRGRLGFEGGRTAVYGDHIGPIVQLELRRSDGTLDTIGTDEMWRAAHGPHLSASLYDGEAYDARLDDAGWTMPGFDDEGWSAVERLPHVADRLAAPPGPPVRRIAELAPVSHHTAASGALLVDFGQNISGRIRIAVSGRAGQRIKIRHAEVLEHGELGTRPLRHALATDEYVLAGGDVEVWEPSFTIHGFRYAEVTGDADDLGIDRMRAVVCHSDMSPTGKFECSHAGLQQLHENVVWSMRGNFVSIPTDCPQRDERLGWSGDIQVFAPSAAFLYDCSGFLDSWLEDLAHEQAELGTVPEYVPWVQLSRPPLPAAAWGDAAVIVPWVLHRRFGDVDILRRQYPSMCRWVEQVASISGDDHLWNTGDQYGDWLDPAAPPDDPGAARTDPGLVATAYHARSTRLLATVADLLGLADDARRFGDLADRITAAFADAFVTPSGRLVSDAPTAYALALEFDLLNGEEQRCLAAQRLVELLERDGYHIGTGFVGTPIICDALAGADRVEEAYHLLLQDGCPSWLYPVTMGATTVWERWDSMLPDGSINPGEMTSFNHYALGAVADFLHRVVAGLAPAEPGYRTLLVRPRPGGGLTHAAATLLTPYGMASVAWRRSGSEMTVDVEVPNGARAIVDLAGQPVVECGPGTHRMSAPVRPAAADPPRLVGRRAEGELRTHTPEEST